MNVCLGSSTLSDDHSARFYTDISEQEDDTNDDADTTVAHDNLTNDTAVINPD